MVSLWAIYIATVVYVYDTKRDACFGKLVKPYDNAMTGFAMIVIQCPHCEEDVELEEGSSGWFSCPHCDEDFSHGEADGEIYSLYSQTQLFMSPGMIIGLTIFGIGLIWFMLLIPSTSGGGLGNLDLIYPGSVCCLGIPIILISFFIRLRQLN